MPYRSRVRWSLEEKPGRLDGLKRRSPRRVWLAATSPMREALVHGHPFSQVIEIEADSVRRGFPALGLGRACRIVAATDADLTNLSMAEAVLRCAEPVASRVATWLAKGPSVV